ncbi:hypothetical protein ABF87_04925 [Nitrosomonas sp. JL21]|uniref:hypothetical protein n=1 Tax=Nitrosomonas sp. JL21 TaxID=153949 RepID=UPI00136DF7B1|nr:hypothetical protein [Nitrosomonas sp. JL21]MBL8496418.1 hypothetical protein [Nitrosomonas sp.]MCC7092145.1 hypothetical protein [Nitrosomonas sp.]MXS77311.1 hypothetical protein [Nitrosomonas sp. JL21]
MDETRRNLIKGMLSGGTLLALGIPGITQAASATPILPDNARNCHLLLGNTLIGEAFATGARAACAHCGHPGQDELATFQLGDELLINPRRIADFLARSHHMRWVAVMDYAHAAIFTELVRNADGHLLALGSHTSISNADAALSLRHRWATASPVYSAGGLLASTLIQNRRSFSIVENFLKAPFHDTGLMEASLPQFSSYSSADQPATHLHCAGVPLPEASQLVGWETSVSWDSLAPQSTASVIEHPQFGNWIEMTGYAVVAAALGVGIHQEACSQRAYVHRPGNRNLDHDGLAGEQFVSFVIDV